MTLVALAVPFAEEQRLDGDAARHGHRVVLRCSGAAETVARIAGSGAELLVAAAEPQYLDAALVSACDAAGVRLVALEGDARLARSLGVLDSVPASAGWEQILSSATVESPPPAMPPISRRSREGLIVVWGAAGAPGRTSVAISVAAELAAAGRSVVLADADTHAASVAPALGLLDESPGFAAACRLAGSGSLDAGEFERIAHTVRTRQGSIRVLTGLGRPRRWPELSADRVRAALAAAREWADAVVVDVAAPIDRDEELSSDLVAARRNAATLTALAEADTVVAVGSADPIGLSRLLRAHAELVESVEPERVEVVVTKVRASAVGINPSAQVRQTLLRFGAIGDPVLVPHDQPAFDAALLSGRVLSDVAPLSPARVAIREFVSARLFAAQEAPAVERRAGRRRGIRRAKGALAAGG